ncbi:MAG: adenylate kinase [Candidatus Peribacteria bacterium]|jgi:adenylate kinase|nr:adenylate kinase [Candidatus Peribacteria bacterium]
MTKQAILLLGAPGSGKGTHAKNLMKEYGFMQVSTGELFRAKVQQADELGKKITDFMNAGVLVPDALTAQMLEEHIRTLHHDKILFDGFPRNKVQLVIFEELLRKLNIDDVIPIYLYVEEGELIRRLLNRAIIEGRADDNEETIAKRIQTYNAQTTPVVEYYATHPKFIQVNGDDQPPEVVWERLKGMLNW